MHPQPARTSGDRPTAPQVRADEPAQAPATGSDAAPNTSGVLRIVPVLRGTRLRAAARAFVMSLGVAAATGLATLQSIRLGLSDRESVIIALLCGLCAGMGLAEILLLGPARRAARDRAAMINRITRVARVDRTEGFDALLAVEDSHELAGLARAVHDALVSAHRDRLEAAALRREMDARVGREAQKVASDIGRLAVTDELTGLLNRRGFEHKLEEAFEMAQRRRQELALLAIDLDRFKQLNDQLGHDKGDIALTAAGEVLREILRAGDFAARAGGDELFVVMYGTGVEGAARAAERIIRSYAAHPASAVMNGLWPTMSIGVAGMRAGKALSAGELKRLADEALYASKRSGRGRVTTFSESPPAEAA